jgi:hypothetical protein
MPEPRKTAQTAAALVLGVAVLAACGGSSKPSYCSSVSTLESSIKALPSTNILQTGLNGLETAVSKVQTDAQTAINSAKSDFPTETSALKSSITALSSTVKSAVSTPTPATIAQIPAQVSATITAVNNFQSATKSKCS